MVTQKAIKYAYQFGDPLKYVGLQDPHSFLFVREDGFSQVASIQMKNYESDLPFSDGKKNHFGNNLSLLSGNDIIIDVIVSADYDLNYLDLIFIRKRKKLFFVQKNNDSYKVFVTFASYKGGLGKTIEDIEIRGGENLKFDVTFSIDSPLVLDITDEVNLLNHQVLSNVTTWSQNIAGSGWGVSTGFGWGISLANYVVPLSSLTINEIEEYLGDFCNPKGYYLSWTNTWVDTLEEVTEVTNGQTITLSSNNTLASFSLSQLDLASSDLNKIWKIQIEHSGGLATDNYVRIENPRLNSGFILTWKGTGNSPSKILFNTAQNYLYDLVNNRVIDKTQYDIQLANTSTYNSFLSIESTKISNVNPNPNILNITPSITTQKNSANNITIKLLNLKTFYI